ncbi:MICOS complex subunit MIC27 [Chanos chanos]|uniref:MICOS complex subunit n=1 Tax=Chanos chanos TaxID=29144 RepID=A0A6J2UNH1_CHACN|nr:MICOS complex subunit MIC27 [Chanos chanos]
MDEAKTERQLSPSELSVYTPRPQRLHFVAEQPSALENGLSAVRGRLQCYVQAVKDTFVGVSVRVVNLYHAGQDVYHFLKEPSPGFLPRFGVIAVSGLGGVILARKGPRWKRLGLPLSLAGAGAAVCYPAQTVAVLKMSGKKLYAASQWTSTAVAALWKPNPIKDTGAPPLISPMLDTQVPTAVPEARLERQVSEIPEQRAVVPEMDPGLVDFGQSNPEDADLYSTRG